MARQPASRSPKASRSPSHGAALLQRNLRGIERNHAARAQAGRVGMNAAKVVEPELRIVVAGIVFNKRELRPAHGAVVPAACAGCGLRRFGYGCGRRADFAPRPPAKDCRSWQAPTLSRILCGCPKKDPPVTQSLDHGEGVWGNTRFRFGSDGRRTALLSRRITRRTAGDDGPDACTSGLPIRRE